MDTLKARLNAHGTEGWRKITATHIRALPGGAGLLGLYRGSVLALLQDTYPEQQLSATNCRARAPHGHWACRDTCAAALGKAAKGAGIVWPDNWRELRASHLKSAGVGGMLSYHGSLQRACAFVIPEASRQSLQPRYQWSLPAERRRFLTALAEARGIEPTAPGAWREVTNAVVLEHGGGGLLRLHGGSLAAALREAFPEAGSGILLGARAPRGHWKSLEARRQFLQDFARARGIQEPHEWRRVTTADVTRAGGSGMLAWYGGKLAPALQECLGAAFVQGREVAYADLMQRWQWRSASERKRFLAWTGEVLNLRTDEDWASVTTTMLIAIGGEGLVEKYWDRIAEEILSARRKKPSATVGSGNGQPKKMRRSRGYWDDWTNRRKFLEEVRAAYDIREPSDWKKVGPAEVQRMGGRRLLSRYSRWQEGLEDIFPELKKELPSAYLRSVPQEHWEHEENVKAFLRHAASELQVEKPEDWLRVSHSQVTTLNGGSLLRNMRLEKALQLLHPDVNWARARQGPRKAAQRQAFLATKEVFPHEDVVEEHRLQVEEGGRNEAFELDIFVPGHSLAIEYNGEHHYHQMAFMGSLEQQQARDMAKQQACEARGIRLVVIPYWWDRRAASLAATVHRKFPSLVPADILSRVGGTPADAVAEEAPRRQRAEPERCLALLLDAEESGSLRVQLPTGKQQLVRPSAATRGLSAGVVVEVGHFGFAGNALRAPYALAALPEASWRDVLQQATQ